MLIFMPKFSPDKLEHLVGPEHAKALRRGQGGFSPEAASALGSLGLGTIAASVRGISSSDQGLDGASNGQRLDMITNRNLQTVFVNSIADTAVVCSRVGLMPPTVDELVAGGIDFVDLSQEFLLMQGLKQQPEVVLAPQYITVEEAKGIFGQEMINIDGDIVANWDLLIGTSNFRGTLVEDEETRDFWSMRIIPGTSSAPELNYDHEGINADGQKIEHFYHPTIPEYLMLQARRLYAGDDRPLDTGTSTWLAGDIDTRMPVSMSPVGYSYYESQGVRVVCLGYEPGITRREDIGIRPIGVVGSYHAEN